MSAQLPPRIKLYLPDALRAGSKWGVDECLILAVLDRETLCGLAKQLDKQGPGGTGDASPRLFHRYAKRADLLPLLKSWRLKSEEEFKHLFPTTRRRQWDELPEVCVPLDGRGWGRGLGQIDLAAHTAWCLEKAADGRFLWEVPEENIDKVAELLHLGIVAFSGDEWLAASSYNAGPGNVREAIAKLTQPSSLDQRHAAADGVTTGKDYGKDVTSRRERFYRQLTHQIPTA